MQAYSVPCWLVGWWLWRAGCISQDTYLLYVFIHPLTHELTHVKLCQRRLGAKTLEELRQQGLMGGSGGNVIRGERETISPLKREQSKIWKFWWFLKRFVKSGLVAKVMQLHLQIVLKLFLLVSKYLNSIHIQQRSNADHYFKMEHEKWNSLYFLRYGVFGTSLFLYWILNHLEQIGCIFIYIVTRFSVFSAKTEPSNVDFWMCW